MTIHIPCSIPGITVVLDVTTTTTTRMVAYYHATSCNLFFEPRFELATKRIITLVTKNSAAHYAGKTDALGSVGCRVSTIHNLFHFLDSMISPKQQHTRIFVRYYVVTLRNTWFKQVVGM